MNRGLAPSPSASMPAARGLARSPSWGVVLSGTVIAAASLAGALVFSLSPRGGSDMGNLEAAGSVVLIGSWALLAAWSLLFAALLRSRAGFSSERALYWAALCHTPLLLCLGLVATLATSEASLRVYADSPYGEVVFRPLAGGYVILAPALAQLLRLVARSRSLLAGAALFGLIAGGSLALRLWNLDWGLPGRFHPDEYSSKALNMIATGDLNPHFFKNPTVMIYAIYVAQSLAAPFISDFQRVFLYFGLPLQDPRNDYLLLLVGRGISALAGTLTVGALYLAGREIFDRKTGLIAASLLGVSLLHVRNSHFATNDVLATSLLTASFLFSARVCTKGRLSDYCLAALLGGLATSTKYTSSLFVLPLLVAHFARSVEPGDGSPVRRHLPLVACGALSLAAFVAGTPYALLDFDSFLADFRFQLALGAEYARGQDPRPAPVLILATLLQGLGVVPMVSALLGAARLARVDPRRLLLLAILPAVYFLSLANQHYFFARFVVPLVPFLALLAGYGLSRSAAWLVLQPPLPAAGTGLTAESAESAETLRDHAALSAGKIASRTAAGLGSSRRRAVAAALLLLVAFSQPVALSTQHDLLLGREDTRSLAASWIESNAPREATIAVETHSLMDNPFNWKGYQTEERRSFWAHDITVFWPEVDRQMNAILEGKYDYAIVTSWGYDSLWGGDSDLSEMPRRYQALDSRGRLVARFGPGPKGGDLPYAVDDGYSPFWHLFDRERSGPTVKIYQMR